MPKEVSVPILLLNDDVLRLNIPAHARGSYLLELLTRTLQLAEAEYFDLDYLNRNQLRCWLDHAKMVLKQVHSVDECAFRFSVRFFLPQPHLLIEEYTRYLFALQIKRDLREGNLLCGENTAALLASYIVQAELGNYPTHNRDNSIKYLEGLKLFPSQRPALLQKVLQFHKTHCGMSPIEADYFLLDTVRKVPLYGMRLHPVKDDDDLVLDLAVTSSGIVILRQQKRINSFSWAKVRKLSFKRRSFLIKLLPGEHKYYDDKIEFIFDSRDECKRFWKACVSYYTFFRLPCSVDKCSSEKSFSTMIMGMGGSSYRYTGRTQKQIMQAMKANKIRQQVTFKQSNDNLENFERKEPSYVDASSTSLKEIQKSSMASSSFSKSVPHSPRIHLDRSNTSYHGLRDSPNLPNSRESSKVNRTKYSSSISPANLQKTREERFEERHNKFPRDNTAVEETITSNKANLVGVKNETLPPMRHHLSNQPSIESTDKRNYQLRNHKSVDVEDSNENNRSHRSRSEPPQKSAILFVATDLMEDVPYLLLHRHSKKRCPPSLDVRMHHRASLTRTNSVKEKPRHLKYFEEGQLSAKCGEEEVNGKSQTNTKRKHLRNYSRNSKPEDTSQMTHAGDTTILCLESSPSAMSKRLGKFPLQRHQSVQYPEINDYGENSHASLQYESSSSEPDDVMNPQHVSTIDLSIETPSLPPSRNKTRKFPTQINDSFHSSPFHTSPNSSHKTRSSFHSSSWGTYSSLSQEGIEDLSQNSLYHSEPKPHLTEKPTSSTMPQLSLKAFMRSKLQHPFGHSSSTPGLLSLNASDEQEEPDSPLMLTKCKDLYPSMQLSLSSCSSHRDNYINDAHFQENSTTNPIEFIEDGQNPSFLYCGPEIENSNIISSHLLCSSSSLPPESDVPQRDVFKPAVCIFSLIDSPNFEMNLFQSPPLHQLPTLVFNEGTTFHAYQVDSPKVFTQIAQKVSSPSRKSCKRPSNVGALSFSDSCLSVWHHNRLCDSLSAIIHKVNENASLRRRNSMVESVKSGRSYKAYKRSVSLAELINYVGISSLGDSFNETPCSLQPSLQSTLKMIDSLPASVDYDEYAQRNSFQANSLSLEGACHSQSFKESSCQTEFLEDNCPTPQCWKPDELLSVASHLLVVLSECQDKVAIKPRHTHASKSFMKRLVCSNPSQLVDSTFLTTYSLSVDSHFSSPACLQSHSFQSQQSFHTVLSSKSADAGSNASDFLYDNLSMQVACTTPETHSTGKHDDAERFSPIRSDFYVL